MQVNFTLSARTVREMKEVAEWLDKPVATLGRQVIETWHESPTFKSLQDRARKNGEAADLIKKLEAQVGADNEEIKVLKRLLGVE